MTTHTERHIADGIKTDFFHPIPASLVAVTVNSVAATYSRPHEQFVRITPTPALGDIVDITFTMLDQPSLGGGSSVFSTGMDADFASVVYLNHFEPKPALGFPYNVANIPSTHAFFSKSVNGTTAKVGTRTVQGLRMLECANAGVAYALFSPATPMRFGTGDFVVEWYVYVDNVAVEAAANNTMWDMRDIGNAVGPAPFVHFTNTGAITYHNNTSAIFTTATGVLTSAQMYYMALARVGGTSRLYRGIVGTDPTAALVGTAADTTNYNSAYSIVMGNSAGYTANLGNFGFTGDFGAIRITKGTGRGFIGATIPVPTGPFPDQ